MGARLLVDELGARMCEEILITISAQEENPQPENPTFDSEDSYIHADGH